MHRSPLPKQAIKRIITNRIDTQVTQPPKEELTIQQLSALVLNQQEHAFLSSLKSEAPLAAERDNLASHKLYGTPTSNDMTPLKLARSLKNFSEEAQRKEDAAYDSSRRNQSPPDLRKVMIENLLDNSEYLEQVLRIINCAETKKKKL